MSQQQHTGGAGLFIIGAVVYVGLLGLFAWQTWFFVDWLYPGDQLLMKVLTLICFDIMAFFWGCLEAFYRFATPGSRVLVRWAAFISFLLSLITTIFYLILESIFRFHGEATQLQINAGYAVSIAAVTLQVLFLTFWLYGEWTARHPHRDDYAVAREPARTVVSVVKPQPRPASKPAPKALPSPRPVAADKDYIDFLRWKKQQAAKKAAQPARTVRAAPSRVAQVAELPEVEEIDDQAETLATSEEVEENNDLVEEIADNDDYQEADEADDEDFENSADTDEIQIVNLAPAEEAVPTKTPFGQRFGQAWTALTSDGTRGPKRLRKVK